MIIMKNMMKLDFIIINDYKNILTYLGFVRYMKGFANKLHKTAFVSGFF